MEDRLLKRKLIIEVFTSGGQWKSYDEKIPNLAEGNDRMRWLLEEQPTRKFRLIEVLATTQEMRKECA